jgi:hypothetical protein
MASVFLARSSPLSNINSKVARGVMEKFNDRKLHREIFNEAIYRRVYDLSHMVFDSDAQAVVALKCLTEKVSDIEALEDFCESPIELMLGAALSFATDGYNPLLLSNPSFYASMALTRRLRALRPSRDWGLSGGSSGIISMLRVYKPCHN